MRFLVPTYAWNGTTRPLEKSLSTKNCKGKTLEELQIPWGAEKPDWDPLSKMITLGDRYYKAVMTQIRLRDQGSYQLDLKKLYRSI